jgi:hypothetical protein
MSLPIVVSLGTTANAMVHAKELAEALKAQGLCTSLKPNKAVEQASKGRLTVSMNTARGIYIAKRRDSNSSRVSAKDLHIMALACKIRGRIDSVYALSEDGLLLQEYDLYADGTYKLTDCRPQAEVIGDLCKLPVSELIRLHGVHPSMDAYINWRLTLPQGGTP